MWAYPVSEIMSGVEPIFKLSFNYKNTYKMYHNIKYNFIIINNMLQSQLEKSTNGYFFETTSSECLIQKHQSAVPIIERMLQSVFCLQVTISSLD